MRVNICKYLILLFIFLSCSKETNELNIDKNIQVYGSYGYPYNGSNILKFRLQTAFLDKDYGIDNFDKYFADIDAGRIENGKLTLCYNNIDEKYFDEFIKNFNNRFLKNLHISNTGAKIIKFDPYDITVFDYENNNIGFLRFESDGCIGGEYGIIHMDSPCSTIYFVYTTEETKITGEDYDDIFDLNLTKGWNKVYWYEIMKYGDLRTMHTTDSKNFPAWIRWKMISAPNPK